MSHTSHSAIGEQSLEKTLIEEKKHFWKINVWKIFLENTLLYKVPFWKIHI